MNAWEWNGTAFAPTAGVPLADRGFRFGMAFFESFPVRRGVAECLQEHVDRLSAAARQCGWVAVKERLQQAAPRVAAMFPAGGSTFARLYLTAGPGPLNAPATEPGLFLYGESRGENRPAPHHLTVHPEPYVPLLGGLKTVNYWANLEALAEAKRSGSSEALLFNPRGELISACMANVFLRLGTKWVTPPLASGARNGVTRERVLRRFPEIREQPVLSGDLSAVTAAFLTSSWVGIAPVATLDSRPLAVNACEMFEPLEP